MKKLIVLCGLLGALAGMFGPHVGGAPAAAHIIVQPLPGDWQPSGGCAGGARPQCFACSGGFCDWACLGRNMCGESYSPSYGGFCYLQGSSCSTAGGTTL